MSVQTIRRATAPVAVPQRRLRLLPSPRPRRRAPRRGLFIAVLVSVLVFGLVSLLLLNTTLAQQSFRLHDLDRQSSALVETEAQLSEQADALTQPQSLAAAAEALGMVPGCDPAFVRSNGIVMGTTQKVTGTRHGSLLVVPPVAGAAPADTVCPGTPAKIAEQIAQKAAADKAKASADAAAAAAGTAPATATSAQGTP